MASTLTSAAMLIKPRLIKTEILKLSPVEPGHLYGLRFSGLTQDEACTLMDCALKLEQKRTGEVLSPTEYGNRFSGLDIE